MKLLLATDGSPASAPALRAVVDRPWPPGSVVRILTVIEIPVAVAAEADGAASLIATRDALVVQAELAVNDARQTVAKGRLPYDTRTREGIPGREIVEEAKEWGADLILLGSHGRTALRRVLMGSVAHYVLSHAPCSVEVAREMGGVVERGAATAPER